MATELLSLSEAAGRYGVDRKLLDDHKKAGTLKVRRAYRQVERGRPPDWFVSTREMERWLAAREKPDNDENDPLLPLSEIARRINVQALRLSRAIKANELPFVENTSLYVEGRGRRPKYLIRLSDARQWKKDKGIVNRKRG